jgi:DNA polymerase III epsilon subunit-like protein
MEENVFQECFERWSKERGNQPYWNELAQKFSYDSGETLRLKFKREKEKRGLKKHQLKLKKSSAPKIIVFDIETSPMKVYSFGLWEQNISPGQIINDSFMLSWSAKYLGDSHVYSDVVTPIEAVASSDKRIVEALWNILDSADYVVGHNVKEFDLKKLNTRFVYHKMMPLSHSKVIDTLQIARSNFAFPSNSLKYINSYLGIKEKVKNEGFELWRKCCEGNIEALKTMREYNDGDVLANEELFYRFLPYFKNLNYNLYLELEDDVCPNCGELTLNDNGFYYTNSGKYHSYRCSECGSISRSKKNLLSKGVKKSLLAK